MLVRRRRRANRSPEKPAGLFCRDREGKGAVRLGPSTGAQVGRRWQGHPNAVPRPRQCHSNLVGAHHSQTSGRDGDGAVEPVPADGAAVPAASEGQSDADVRLGGARWTKRVYGRTRG